METKKCQYCLSNIPKNAKKCKYCLEWQEEQDVSTQKPKDKQVFDFAVRFPNAKKPFQLSIIRKIPLHYGVSVFIIGVICFVLIQLSWYKYDEDSIYLISFMLFATQMIISWAGLIWIYKIINDNYKYFIEISSLEQVDAEHKFIYYHSKMFNNKYSIIVGILIGLIASIGDFIIGTPFNTIQAKLIFAGFEFLNMFFAGAAIYSMLMFAFFLHTISSSTNNEALNLGNNETISNIGNIHLKSSVLAIVPLFLGVIAKLVGDWNWDIVITLWYVSFAIAIVIYIYWPMFNIHLLMKHILESQSRIIQTKIHKLLMELKYNPSSRNFIKLNELRELEKSILGENTWPFEMKSLSAAFFAIILPIILIIIDKFLVV